jgi:hypothetical protein
VTRLHLAQNRAMDSLDAVVGINPDKIVKVANFSEELKKI